MNVTFGMPNSFQEKQLLEIFKNPETSPDILVKYTTAFLEREIKEYDNELELEFNFCDVFAIQSLKEIIANPNLPTEILINLIERILSGKFKLLPMATIQNALSNPVIPLLLLENLNLRVKVDLRNLTVGKCYPKKDFCFSPGWKPQLGSTYLECKITNELVFLSLEEIKFLRFLGIPVY